MPDESVPIRSLDLTLCWPIRLQAQGTLYEARRDSARPPAFWLDEYARWTGEEEAADSKDRFHSAHHWLAADVAHYLAVFEFSEVSNQIQAREIFAMLRRNLGTAELLQELSRQLDFAAQVERNHFSDRMLAAQVDLADIANLWVRVSIAISAAVMLFTTVGRTWFIHPPEIVQRLGIPWSWPVQTLVVIGLSALLYLAWAGIRKALPRMNRAAPRPARLWVVPVNDLESQEIVRLLGDAGENVHAVSVGWGARWDNLPDDLRRTIETFRREQPAAQIYGVELGGRNSLGAVNIDHHWYSGDDRRNPSSSIEQALAILNKVPDADQRRIATNDRAWIPGLLADGLAWNEIREMRRRDRRAQRLTEADEARAATDLDNAHLPSETCPWVVRCNGRLTSAHTDIFCETRRAVAPMLLTGPSEWLYTGPAAFRLIDTGFEENAWGGGDASWGYFGIAHPGIEAQQRIRTALGIALDSLTPIP